MSHVFAKSSTNHQQGKITYTLEFHLPYYALRKFDRQEVVDPRRSNNKPLRLSRLLPLAPGGTADDLYYHEAQISFCITGVDECMYTSYCLVDTYHGSEKKHSAYLNPPTFIEPSTGGEKDLEYPIWNPRELFLCVLSIRLQQVIGESQALIDAFEERMDAYVSGRRLRGA